MLWPIINLNNAMFRFCDVINIPLTAKKHVIISLRGIERPTLIAQRILMLVFLLRKALPNATVAELTVIVFTSLIYWFLHVSAHWQSLVTSTSAAFNTKLFLIRTHA